MQSLWQQFRQDRWPQGVRCVRCAALRVRLHSVKPSGAQRYACARCGRVFSDATGTFLQGSKVGLVRWQQAHDEFAKNRLLTARELSRRCRVSYPTARRMRGVMIRMARVLELEKCNGGGDGLPAGRQAVDHASSRP